MNNGRNSTLVIALGIALLASGWALARLAEFQQTRQTTVVYTDAPDLQANPNNLSCRQGRRLDLDIRDYSNNVVAKPGPSSIHRYKTNLDAEPPVHVHILSIRGGSGRVVVAETDKPVWLVLISSQPAIWHIERAPGATVDRVVASQTSSELHFSNTLVAEADSLLELLFGEAPDAAAMPDIQVIPHSTCMAALQRFQKYDDRKKFIPALQGLRAWLGHPEMSFQSASHPSYFELPFRVPFEEPDVSIDRLAAVAKLAEPPKAAPSNQQPEPDRAVANQFERYANMQRRSDVKAITFANSGELVAALDAYRNKGLIPSLMPASGRGGRGLDVAEWYSLSDYRGAYTRRVPTGITEDACNGGRDHEFLIIDGTNGTNSVKCAWGKQMYFTRGGDDHIDDSWEDDVIYAGTGNDTIDAGWGSDLLFFNYGWGQDVVEKTCHNAAYRPQDSAGARKVNWSTNWPYKSFIVFGRDVSREDIVRVDNKLVHKQTGDSVTLKNDCFNIVYWQ
ncbi:MAG: hypothetical protein QNI98_03335 [Woeseiaceae bacterium]|nr:hypothetical protein [Woeseiaceae bacterium]